MQILCGWIFDSQARIWNLHEHAHGCRISDKLKRRWYFTFLFFYLLLADSVKSFSVGQETRCILLSLLCNTWQNLSSFSRRWRRMCRDVKISPDVPMSIPLTAPWPWGEFIPGQCAKLHELQYPPIGWTLASILTQKHSGTVQFLFAWDQEELLTITIPTERWWDQAAGYKHTCEQRSGREVNANLMHSLCIDSKFAAFLPLTLLAGWDVIVKTRWGPAPA